MVSLVVLVHDEASPSRAYSIAGHAGALAITWPIRHEVAETETELERCHAPNRHQQ